jgi:Chalcone isomerase-like
MFKRAHLLAFVAVVLAPLVLGAPVFGAECLGVQFPDSVKAGNTELVLNGLGLRKATIFSVKVYVAGLYLPKKSGDGGQIAGANQPWELVLRFVHDVDASEIRDAFEEGFKKAAGDNFDALRKRIDDLNARMVDFKVGQHLSYAYDPTKGTVVDVNGTSGGAIDGADFAAALLTISIGPEPPNEDLKSGLLGGKCE